MSAVLTPMMQQYRRLRDELPRDVILFFRLGDFYEMFFEDAAAAAPVLDIALTKRNGVPMCGVPYHAADSYISRLLAAGRKVAVCDQIEDASAARGIVKRDITRIVTPGTVVEGGLVEAGRNRFLAGLARSEETWGLALLDLSTGSFVVEECACVAEAMEKVRQSGAPECVLPESLAGADEFMAGRQAAGGVQFSGADDWTFGMDAARSALLSHFAVKSLDGYGCEGANSVVMAAGGVLQYVRDRLRRQVSHVRRLRYRRAGDHMVLDEATCGNLDLVPRRGQQAAATLLGVLDDTCTAMGARLLWEWITHPLISVDAIVERQSAVAEFCAHRPMLSEFREMLRAVRDMERIIARLGGGGNARDLAALGASLSAIPGIAQVFDGAGSPLLRSLAAQLRPQPELVDLLGRAVADEPPAVTREGGMIRDGYSGELDELRVLAAQGREWLGAYQAREQERTGIRTLKVRHNKVFGYYIEVSRGQSDKVPSDYVRKQTLVNAERFITPELKDYENRVLGAQERAVALEAELFQELRAAAVARAPQIQECAEAMAQLDVLASLAGRALAWGYVRPRVTDGTAIRIVAGRHPVVDRMQSAERFVPNDALLDAAGHQIIVITGPNMAGKSTYIRQVALLVIMAQMGSFIPAEEAETGIVDRVFTRVGASDDLARGRSTFMVEMQETANILNNATSRSLVVLDEIGRGTSTFDGISIAWAVAEHLHNTPEVKAKTLFATHYHELADIERELAGVKNYNIQVRESGDRIVFLRKIVRGCADKSYGIQVARLAGMPDAVVERAKEILANLEEGEFVESGQPRLARKRKARGRGDAGQMNLF
ncbi:MAG: DNA mismatch repair protein MutS [Lentisphaerae bacterium]|nr:DNA mismatch repair protein MutS [Lentisphaerota bacterium]